MAEQENLVLEQLRIMRNDNRDMRNEMREALDDIKHRLTSLERGQARIMGDSADSYADQASQQLAIDRLNTRLQRVERRLELRDDA